MLDLHWAAHAAPQRPRAYYLENYLLSVTVYSPQASDDRDGPLAFTSVLVRPTLQLWNSMAALPIGSFYHTACLTTLLMPLKGVLAI